jgi:hypothetical protein
MPKGKTKQRGGYASGDRTPSELIPPQKMKGLSPYIVTYDELTAPQKGEPYSRVKAKGRYMLTHLRDDDFKRGFYQARSVIERLIESAPHQALDALCDVLGDD